MTDEHEGAAVTSRTGPAPAEGARNAAPVPAVSLAGGPLVVAEPPSTGPLAMTEPFTTGPLAMVVTEARSGRIQAANPAYLDLTGYTSRELLGRTAEQLGICSPRVGQTQEAAPGGAWQRATLRTRDGTTKEVLLGWQRYPNGERDLHVSYLVDVTASVQAERQLKRFAEFRSGLMALIGESLHRGLDEGFYQRALEHAVKAVPGAQAASLMLRGDGDRFHFVAAVGFDRRALADCYLLESEIPREGGLSGPQTISYRRGQIEDDWRSELLATAGRAGEIQVSLSTPVELDGRVIAYFNLDNFEDPEAFDADAVQMATDLAQQLAALLRRFHLETELRRQAHHDALTGLPNRHLALDRLEQALHHARRSGSRVAVMFLDLDEFKRVNDTRGHTFGDLLVGAVARRLAHVLRTGDTVARWGGDEFLVLLPDLTGPSDAVGVARKIVGQFQRPFVILGQEVTTSVSVGVSVYPDNAVDTEELIDRADIALYRAKQAGKDGFEVYDPSMDERLRTRLDHESDLREAIERGALTTRFQPRVGLRHGGIDVIEMSVGWEHPMGGLLGWEQLFQRAERAGLGALLSDRVLDEACRHARAWSKAHQTRLSLPLCTARLHAAGFDQSVSHALARHGLAGDKVEFRIAARPLMTDLGGAVSTLTRLRELGVRITLEGFGAGPGSLLELQRLPVDRYKLDRAFVDALEQTDPASERAARVLEGVVALARGLGAPSVAPGVENPEQFRLLRSLGCEYAVGPLFGGPVPAPAVPALLEEAAWLPGAP